MSVIRSVSTIQTENSNKMSRKYKENPKIIHYRFRDDFRIGFGGALGDALGAFGGAFDAFDVAFGAAFSAAFGAVFGAAFGAAFDTGADLVALARVERCGIATGIDSCRNAARLARDETASVGFSVDLAIE